MADVLDIDEMIDRGVRDATQGRQANPFLFNAPNGRYYMQGYNYGRATLRA